MGTDPLFWIALAACIGVLAVRLLGIDAFRRGGAHARANSNKFMRWRLMAQFGAVVLILAFVLVRRQTGG